MTYISLLGWVAASIGASFAFFQIRHTLKTRTTAGMSRLSWSAMSFSTGMWLAYGLVGGFPQQIAANTPWILMEVLLGVYFTRERRLPRLLAPLYPVFCLLPGVLLNVYVSWLLAPLAIFMRLAIAVPQFRSSSKSAHREGVSLASWVASCVSGVCWTVYGIGIHAPAVWLTSILGLVLSVLNVLALSGRTHRLFTTRA